MNRQNDDEEEGVLAKRRRRTLTGILVIAGVLVVIVVAIGFLQMRRGFGERAVPADVPAAKRAGDVLLASSGRTFLVVVAHPDDAEWWVGGTLGMLARHNRVILVIGTSGEKGNLGIQRDLGAIRERLQREAAKILGYSDVIFLRHPDGRLGQARDYPGQIADLVSRYAPDGIVSFDVQFESQGYRHPDHEAAGRAALGAARERGDQRLYLFHTSKPDIIADYGPVKNEKARALSVVASYHDAGPLGWLSKLARAVGLEHAAISYGSRSSFPQVGVEYGELLRQETTPPR